MGTIRREMEIITKDQKQCLGLKMLQQIKNEECVEKACIQNGCDWGIAKAWGYHNRISKTEKEMDGDV